MADKLNEQQYRDSAFPEAKYVDISGGDFPLPSPAPIMILGDGGEIELVLEDDTEITTSHLNTGFYFPGKVKTVKKASTTATNIVYFKLK